MKLYEEVISELPKWLQHAAKWIYKHGTPTDEQISEFADLCKKEANGEPVSDVEHPQYFQGSAQDDGQELRLSSIGNVEGVNSLGPGKALGFEESNITVVYGPNGSGKSSYVRLLKHACGARHPGTLLPNVYLSQESAQQAEISFKQDDKDKKIIWGGNGPCEELKFLHIFDDSYGSVFIDQGDAVSYEPPELAFISSLIKVCDLVKEKLGAEANTYPARKPNMLQGCKDSEEGKWYDKLNANTSAEDLEKYCTFSEENKKELDGLRVPEHNKKLLEGYNRHINSILNDVQKHLQQLSDEACKQVISLHKDAIKKKEIAETAAKQAFYNSQLEGIGRDTWKELWKAARKYSEEVAYKGQVFPKLDEDARCVLCHQSLSEDAQKRFSSFEDYVKGSTQVEADNAQKAWEVALQNIKDMYIPDEGTLMSNIDNAGILENNNVKESLLRLYKALRIRKEKLSALKSEDELPPKPGYECIEEIKSIRNNYDKDIKKYSQEANKEQLNGLEAREWLAANRSAIEDEIKRLQHIGKIQKAQKLTNTTSLSRKKGGLSEELITKPFVDRFNKELEELNVRVKVKLEKTQTQKGHVAHRLKLEGAIDEYQNCLKEVLSEGEKRVVSIAAFLADVRGKELRAPIVFDDPTSSLDSNFEEAFAKRLSELSKERQVIIFTHRLPLLRYTQDEVKQAKVSVKYIFKRGQVSGEPHKPSLDIENIGKSLSELEKSVNELIKSSNNNNYDNTIVSSTVKGFYTELRTICERVIEKDLLSNIVVRDREDIRSREIKKLTAITEENINTLEKLIEKCNDRMHPKSAEKDLTSLDPSELKSTIEELQKWRKEFNRIKEQRAT